MLEGSFWKSLCGPAVAPLKNMVFFGGECCVEKMMWMLCREHSVRAGWHEVFVVNPGTIGAWVLLSQIEWHLGDCFSQ